MDFPKIKKQKERDITIDEFKIGTKVNHYNYGIGKVIEDKEGICGKLEVMVEFENSLPFLKPSAIAGYPGHHNSEKTMYIKKDAIYKKELKVIK